MPPSSNDTQNSTENVESNLNEASNLELLADQATRLAEQEWLEASSFQGCWRSYIEWHSKITGNKIDSDTLNNIVACWEALKIDWEGTEREPERSHYSDDTTSNATAQEHGDSEEEEVSNVSSTTRSTRSPAASAARSPLNNLEEEVSQVDSSLWSEGTTTYETRMNEPVHDLTSSG